MAEQLTFEFNDRPTIKGFPELRWTGKRPYHSTQYFPAQLRERYGEEQDGWINKIYWGDNLQVMSHLMEEFRGKVDLIYIDPPFDSKADYKMKIKVRGKEVSTDSTTFEEKQYGDIWTNDEYLQFMYERLILLRELLSDKGSVYLHCDWNKSHMLRMVLDEVFGPDNMMNEIIRKYSVGGKSVSFFARKHDTIFLYAKKIDKAYFNSEDVRVPFTPHKQDKSGRNYGGRMGIDEDGRPYVEKWGTGNKKLYRYYLDIGKIPEDVWEIEDDMESMSEIENALQILKRAFGNGVLVDDVWESQTIQSAAKERTNYPTQKPESLLERIIRASCPINGIVFDCFMGSGTTQAVAMKLGRRFIGADINLGAIQTTTKRLISLAAELESKNKTEQENSISKNEEDTIKTNYTGFEVYNVNNYEFFRNPIEARDLLMEALEIQPFPQSNIWDGELDGRMVKIMPVNRIATKADLEELKANLPYKTYEKRKEENPNQPVEQITIVCMGHEPDLKASLEAELSEYKPDIEIVDILRDKADLQLKRDSETDIAIEGGRLVIRAFYPLNLMQKLSLQKEYVEDWRQLVESVMIDWNYDGVVMQPTVTDVPGKNDIVKGIYDIPEEAGTIKVKITDLLSESLETEVR